jgi:simple sugar transport system ATP-binding protein
MAPVLEARDVTKTFPGVLANDRIDFSLEKGEVLAFLGENGAGKTTLMNILYGLYTQDEGRIFLNGQEVEIQSPSDAIAQGIGMVHQHFMLVPVMTVAENVVLGTETQSLFGLNLTALARRLQTLFRRLNPTPYLHHHFEEPYRLSRAALTWAILYLLFFGFEFLLFLLNRSFWGVLIAGFVLGLFWLGMLVDCWRRPAESFAEASLKSKPAWAAIIVVGNVIGAAAYYFLVARRQTIPWPNPRLGRVWGAGLALIVALAISGLAALIGLLPTLAVITEGLLRFLLVICLAYIGLWVLLGLYLMLLEVLEWFTELVPLGLNADARRVREISQQFGLDVDPWAYIKDLPVGIQQRVEIIKALYRQADILILDEPTAVLTPQETVELFEVMRSLISQDKSIIFITHKLKEVLTVADRIIVLRDGRVVGETRPTEATEASLAAMMVGREVILTVDKEPAQPQDVVLKVENLHAEDDRHQPMVNGVNLEVRAGEILGVAGVQGNGQTELVEVLTGLRSSTEGHVWIMGTETTHASPRQIIELGVAHIPEDRQKDGMVLSYPVYDNLVLCTYYQPPFARGILINDEAIFRQADELVRTFDIRTPTIALPANNLSGGNQQKLIVARELSRPIKLLIAAQPTRGLDVGSIEFIHKRLIEKRDDGAAVLLVSAELDEIMSLSDRIAVMYEGKVVCTMDADKTSREECGLWMTGGRGEELATQPESG